MKIFKTISPISRNKYGTSLLIVASAYFIFRAGKSTGEFIYYLTQ